MLFRPAAILLCLALPATAQDADCADAVTQYDMNSCAAEDLQVQDDNLNAAYAAAKSILKDIDADLPKAEQGAIEALLAAQRAWITFRDQACTAEGFLYQGGSMQPMVISGCLARITAARAQDLWLLSEQY
ncbi:MAG: lysozyme inhibitor LprI family protein [Paracoccaceae bacterium]